MGGRKALFLYRHKVDLDVPYYPACLLAIYQLSNSHMVYEYTLWLDIRYTPKQQRHF